MDPRPELLLDLLRRRVAAQAGRNGGWAGPGACPVVQPEGLISFLIRWHRLLPAGWAADPADPAAGAGFSGPAGFSGSAGPDALAGVLAQLDGAVLAVRVLETDVLAGRLAGYQPRWLDDLCAAGAVVWVGAGEGRVVLARREVAALVLPALGFDGSPAAGLDGPIHRRIREVLGRDGSGFFRDLGRAEHSDGEVLAALWDLAWAGEVTCDSFAPLRAVSPAGGRRAGQRVADRPGSGLPGPRTRPRPGSLRAAGPPGGQGRWSLVSTRLTGAEHPGLRPALVLAEALLERHGVLTGEAIRAEGIPGGAGSLWPALETLAEAGLCLPGRFSAGAGASQFALPEALGLLQGAGRDDGAFLMSAVDPANPYGAAVGWPVAGPSRLAGAHVLVVGGVGSLYVETGGRGLVALRSLDGTWEEAAVEALAASVGRGRGQRWRRLSLARYPESLAPVLVTAGFVPSPKGLVLYG